MDKINFTNIGQEGGVAAGVINNFVSPPPPKKGVLWKTIITFAIAAVAAAGAVGFRVFKGDEPKAPQSVVAPTPAPTVGDPPTTRANPPGWEPLQGSASRAAPVALEKHQPPLKRTKGKKEAMGGDSKGDTINFTNIGQQGGVAAGKIEKIEIYGQAPARPPHDALRNDRLTKLPRDKPVMVFGTIHDSESMAFAREIHQFLSENGFKMTDSVALESMFFGVRPTLVNVGPGEGGKETWITIGARI
jgi:hypothetical protein